MKLQVACLLVVVVGALPLHPLVDPGTCPDGIHTACASDGSATCCPIFMSQSGYGCCHLPNASCCPASSTTQGCCPSGTKCVLTGPYAATCVPDAGGKNISATQVCTPGALEPPSNFTVPAAIVIGDSVSIGYTPAVASVLTGKIAVQHSPWAGGVFSLESAPGWPYVYVCVVRLCRRRC